MAFPKKTSTKLGAKGATVQYLPDDVLTDLKHVMEDTIKQHGVITRADFKNIVHNFGHYSIRQKVFEEELYKHGFDPKQPTFNETEVITLITSLWYHFSPCSFEKPGVRN